MALRLSTDLKNWVVSTGAVQAIAGTCGTGGTGVLKIYTGSQPSSADDAATGTLLVTIENLAWGDADTGTTSGTAALLGTANTAGAATAGTAGWGRLEAVSTGYSGSAATFRIDGDVGTAGTCVFVINNPVVTADALVSLLTANIKLS